MTLQISKYLKKKILNNFNETVYRDLNLTIDQFFYFFHFVDFEKELYGMFETESIKDIKDYFYVHISIYKFFINGNCNQSYNDDLGQDFVKCLNKVKRNKELEFEPSKPKNYYKPKKKTFHINPNQLSFNF